MHIEPKVIQIQVNGDPFSSAEGMTIAQLIQEMQLENKRIAVEVNENIVPRSQHEGYALTDGDKVEVVTAIGGG